MTTTQEPKIEPALGGPNLPVPGADEQRRDEQGRAAHGGRDAERPGQRDPSDHGLGRERVHDPADARPRGADAVGQAPLLLEPLRDDGGAGDVGASDAGADQDALRQVELPGAAGEGGGDESRRYQDGSEEHGSLDAVPSGEDGHAGGDEHGCGEVQTADESVVDGGGFGEAS